MTKNELLSETKKSNGITVDDIMNLQDDLQRTEIIECIGEYGFTKGSEVYLLHKWFNLESNKHKSRRMVEIELIDKYRIRKLSKSTFDKTMSMLNKIKHRLMSSDMKQKLDLFIEKMLSE